MGSGVVTSRGYGTGKGGAGAEMRGAAGEGESQHIRGLQCMRVQSCTLNSSRSCASEPLLFCCWLVAAAAPAAPAASRSNPSAAARAQAAPPQGAIHCLCRAALSLSASDRAHEVPALA